jgi:hypothetical protein
VLFLNDRRRFGIVPETGRQRLSLQFTKPVFLGG